MPATFLAEGQRVLKRLIGMDDRISEHSLKSVCLTNPDEQTPRIGILLQFDEKGFQTAMTIRASKQLPVFEPVAGIEWLGHKFVVEGSVQIVEEFLICVMAERYEQSLRHSAE